MNKPTTFPSGVGVLAAVQHYSAMADEARSIAQFEAREKIIRAFHRAPAVGPVDTRSSLEKIVRAVIRSGQPVYVGEMQS